MIVFEVALHEELVARVATKGEIGPGVDGYLRRGGLHVDEGHLAEMTVRPEEVSWQVDAQDEAGRTPKRDGSVGNGLRNQ